jgi:hypothetical protein
MIKPGDTLLKKLKKEKKLLLEGHVCKKELLPRTGKSKKIKYKKLNIIFFFFSICKEIMSLTFGKVHMVPRTGSDIPCSHLVFDLCNFLANTTHKKGVQVTTSPIKNQVF